VNTCRGSAGISRLRGRIFAGGGQHAQQHVGNMSRKTRASVRRVAVGDNINRSEPNTGTLLWSVLAALRELRGSRFSHRFRRGSGLTGCDLGSFG
jgi:hypothetical protein